LAISLHPANLAESLHRPNLASSASFRLTAQQEHEWTPSARICTCRDGLYKRVPRCTSGIWEHMPHLGRFSVRTID